MAGFSGKGKEPLCKDELFVAISASIKLNRDRVRAPRFDPGEVHRANRSHEEETLLKIYREGGKLDGCSEINMIFQGRKILENIPSEEGSLTCFLEIRCSSSLVR